MSEPAGARSRRPAPISFEGVEAPTATRLSDEVAELIRAFIVRENVPEGARLPSERDLAERFRASRPTVSQALRSLALMGLVEVRRGSGAYVLRRPETMVTASVGLMLDLDRRSVHELMQLRLWLETLGVREAASRQVDAPRGDELRLALDRLVAAAGHAAEWVAADTIFHVEVLRACGNSYLAAMFESVHTALVSYEFRRWVDEDHVPDWLREAGPEQQRALHEPILAAVLGSDPDAAAKAVETHHLRMLEHLEAAFVASPPS